MVTRRNSKLTFITALLIMLLGLTGGVAFAQGSLGGSGTAKSGGDSDQDNPSKIRANYIKRYPSAGVFAPKKMGGHDSVEKQESKGPGTIKHEESGPVQTWPQEVKTLQSSVPTLRDEGISENLFETTGYPVSDTQFQIISRMNDNIMLEQMFDPERVNWMVTSMGAIQATSLANSTANLSRNQANSAIEFCQQYLPNFTVDKGNRWNKIYDNLFIPMAFLLLLPGAVLAQVRAIVAQSSPIFQEVNPFDGIIRSIVAIFLIPATYLVVNFGIDVSNSIAYTIGSEYKRMFGTDMYEDAQIAQAKAFPINKKEDNLNGIMPGKTPQATGDTPQAKLEGAMHNVATEKDADGNKTSNVEDEAVPALYSVGRGVINTANAGMLSAWNVLCAFQMAYLHYMFVIGPVVAALWVWPMDSLRKAFPSWCEGVVTLCFWSLFWHTTIMLMACFKGVDTTGTYVLSALNFLANACVRYAFDFTGLIGNAGAGAGQAMQKAMSGGSAGGGGGGGHGASAGAGHGAGQGAGSAAGGHAGGAQAGGAGVGAGAGAGSGSGGGGGGAVVGGAGGGGNSLSPGSQPLADALSRGGGAAGGGSGGGGAGGQGGAGSGGGAGGAGGVGSSGSGGDSGGAGGFGLGSQGGISSGGIGAGSAPPLSGHLGGGAGGFGGVGGGGHANQTGFGGAASHNSSLTGNNAQNVGGGHATAQEATKHKDSHAAMNMAQQQQQHRDQQLAQQTAMQHANEQKAREQAKYEQIQAQQGQGAHTQAHQNSIQQQHTQQQQQQVQQQQQQQQQQQVAGQQLARDAAAQNAQQLAQQEHARGATGQNAQQYDNAQQQAQQQAQQAQQQAAYYERTGITPPPNADGVPLSSSQAGAPPSYTQYNAPAANDTAIASAAAYNSSGATMPVDNSSGSAPADAIQGVAPQTYQYSVDSSGSYSDGATAYDVSQSSGYLSDQMGAVGAPEQVPSYEKTTQELPAQTQAESMPTYADAPSPTLGGHVSADAPSQQHQLASMPDAVVPQQYNSGGSASHAPAPQAPPPQPLSREVHADTYNQQIVQNSPAQRSGPGPVVGRASNSNDLASNLINKALGSALGAGAAIRRPGQPGQQPGQGKKPPTGSRPASPGELAKPSAPGGDAQHVNSFERFQHIGLDLKKKKASERTPEEEALYQKGLEEGWIQADSE